MNKSATIGLATTAVDAGATLMNAVQPRGTGVRRGDCHIILRKC